MDLPHQLSTEPNALFPPKGPSVQISESHRQLVRSLVSRSRSTRRSGCLPMHHLQYTFAVPPTRKMARVSIHKYTIRIASRETCKVGNRAKPQLLALPRSFACMHRAGTQPFKPRDAFQGLPVHPYPNGPSICGAFDVFQKLDLRDVNALKPQMNPPVRQE